MPEVEEDLIDGLALEEINGVLTLTRVFFCKDLEGADAVTTLASALLLTDGGNAHTGADVPGEFDSLTVNGKTLYVQSRKLSPWPPADAEVRVVYTETPRTIGDAGFGPTQWECGASLEQGETDFDWANMQLPFDQRTPIEVAYTPAGGEERTAQNPRVPVYLIKPTMQATREETDDPSDRASEFVGYTNSKVFRGREKNTVLCMEIRGRNPGNTGKWTTTYQFAEDRNGKWMQIARWTEPFSGQPPRLAVADLAAENGIKQITVQGEKDFDELDLG